jgi:hypothetical protein
VEVLVVEIAHVAVDFAGVRVDPENAPLAIDTKQSVVLVQKRGQSGPTPV